MRTNPTSRWVDVTPEMAQEWLDRNTHNRTIRMSLARAYADDMRSGRWVANGETIKFSASGELDDGQHRLLAVVISGMTIRFLVIEGLGLGAQETVDTGARRTLGDVLKLRGESHYNALAATLRAVGQWESGKVAQLGGGGHFSNSRLLMLLDEYPWIRDGMSTLKLCGAHVHMPASVAGLAWFLFHRIDADDCAHFFARLVSEESHHAGEPIFELRKVLERSVTLHGERSKPYLLAVTIKAWNKYRAGESVGLLTYKPGGARPESFPEPK